MPFAHCPPGSGPIHSGISFGTFYARDAGMRINHFLLSPALEGRWIEAQVDRHLKFAAHQRLWQRNSRGIHGFRVSNFGSALLVNSQNQLRPRRQTHA